MTRIFPGKRRLLLVFGAPRSGLSALSRCLELMGFATVSPDVRNTIEDILERLCRDLGYAPHISATLSPDRLTASATALEAVERLRDLLESHVSAPQPESDGPGGLFLAHPLLCRTLPLWDRVLDGLGIEPSHVHLLRHPAETALALGEKQGIRFLDALLLWLTHVRDAHLHLDARPHVPVTFDALLADPAAALSPIIAALPGGREARPPDLEQVLLQHVQPGLKHHHASSPLSLDDRRRLSACERFYNALLHPGRPCLPAPPSTDDLAGLLLEALGTRDLGLSILEIDIAAPASKDRYERLELHLRQALAEIPTRLEDWPEAIRRWQDIAAQLGPRTPAHVYERLDHAYRSQKSYPKGSSLEETVTGDGNKYELLSSIHQALEPALYLEIGVQKGVSLRLARGKAIGVDPMLQLEVPLPPTTQVFSMTSDEFFQGPAAQCLDPPPDLVFIDGMHLFEYALRDFMNVERHCAPWTLVVIDDIFPGHPAQAARRRRTRAWTGDVWKLHSALETHRPDLFLLPLDASPTGLLLIAGLDPQNRVLQDTYDTIVRRYPKEQLPPPAVIQRESALSSRSEAAKRLLDLLDCSRRNRLDHQEVARLLRNCLKIPLPVIPACFSRESRPAPLWIPAKDCGNDGV